MGFSPSLLLIESYFSRKQVDQSFDKILFELLIKKYKFFSHKIQSLLTNKLQV
jgi:hypothetical protein